MMVPHGGDGAGSPISIVKGAEAPLSHGLMPVIALWTGIGLAVILGVWAVILRRRAVRTEGALGTPERGPGRAGGSEVGALAKALGIARAERRAVESLALVAGVAEPAVLLVSEFAFWNAARAARERVPGGDHGLRSLGARLGYTTPPADEGDLARVARSVTLPG